MAKFHESGESVEGLEICGASRDPIRYMRTKKLNTKTCHVYKAAFNVSATVNIALVNETQLIASSHCNKGDDISCDSAVIINTDKREKYSEGLISNHSATHGINEY